MWLILGYNKANRNNGVWRIGYSDLSGSCSSISSPPKLVRDAGRVAFLCSCILNSLFYAARNELEKIGGPPPPFLNGVVTSGDAPATLEAHRPDVTTAPCSTMQDISSSRVSSVTCIPKKEPYSSVVTPPGTMPLTVSCVDRPASSSSRWVRSAKNSFTLQPRDDYFATSKSRELLSRYGSMV